MNRKFLFYTHSLCLLIFKVEAVSFWVIWWFWWEFENSEKASEGLKGNFPFSPYFLMCSLVSILIYQQTSIMNWLIIVNHVTNCTLLDYYCIESDHYVEKALYWIHVGNFLLTWSINSINLFTASLQRGRM